MSAIKKMGIGNIQRTSWKKEKKEGITKEKKVGHEVSARPAQRLKEKQGFFIVKLGKNSTGINSSEY